jgi:hypothetical protein
MSVLPISRIATACATMLVVGIASTPAAAAKVTECTKVALCYCVNDELKPAINEKVEKYRQTLADQRKAGKAVGYLSIPLSPAGGGNFAINREVGAAAKKAIEKRYGADYIYVLDPTAPEADLAKGTGGAEYMLMWTAILEGTDGMGDFDFVYFAGPADFARYFGFDGNNDMAKLDAYFDRRVAADADFAKAVQGGLTKASFRRYYALRASANVSRGAHDEWNIVRIINEKRRADSKFGTPGQVAVLFDGQGVSPQQQEAPISEGYVGKCAL